MCFVLAAKCMSPSGECSIRSPTSKQLHLPDIYRQTIEKSNDGLILVSGVTGSGKSSTLAAMLDYVNTHSSIHIITVEDPVEYRFKPKRCIISQREIGIDVANFADALRYVVRQDPDAILVGELRDRETMLAAIQAAETGHLVLGSLHCADAEQTFRASSNSTRAPNTASSARRWPTVFVPSCVSDSCRAPKREAATPPRKCC